MAKKKASKKKTAKKRAPAMKTRPTGGSLAAYFAGITPAAKRAEVEQVHALIRRVAPDLEPRVWGQFIGYGTFHYRYASGREGDWFVLGLGGKMKTGISIYACATKGGRYVAEAHAAALRPASVGKSCIRFRSLAAIDLAALERVLREAASADRAM